MKKSFFRLILSIIMLTAAYAECISSGPELQIFAVKYGRSEFQKRFVFYGDKSGGTVPFSWMFYCIRYRNKIILVDTGFNDPKMARAFGVSDFKDPVAILRENGIDADKVTDVIITHSHFDHIGNAHRFKNARFIINKEELAELNKDKSLGEVKKFFNGNPKVEVFDESYVLYDLFSIKKIGGHTKGSSVIFFKYGSSEYCFTGDEVYLQDNVLKNTGNGSAVNHKSNNSFVDLLNKSSYRLFIFHDNRYADSKNRFIKVFPSE
jgi:glyoxylase-like metal-dependent hydrolase (beta-lactamase superfamily II)